LELDNNNNNSYSRKVSLVVVATHQHGVSYRRGNAADGKRSFMEAVERVKDPSNK
jgi:hypothetical protein